MLTTITLKKMLTVRPIDTWNRPSEEELGDALVLRLGCDNSRKHDLSHDVPWVKPRTMARVGATRRPLAICEHGLEI